MNFSLSDLLSFLPDSWNSWDLSDEATREFLTLLGVRLSLLAICVCVSLLLGRIVPSLLRSLGARAVPDERRKQYDDFVGPLVDTAKLTVSLILVDVSLNVIRNYEGPFVVLKFIADLAATISIAWLFSKAARQFIRIYGINLIRRVSPDVNELILVLQTTVNVFIGFFAVAIFAQSRDVNLAALLAGFGIGGIAVAFAAQETLGQVLATIVLYLDRPYVPGEYVRVNFKITAEDVYGRIESIGLRSTKIRIAVSNTLLVVPNSVMVAKDIENISRGTKVMVLLHMDFRKPLQEDEEAFVRQTIKSNVTDELFTGLDPGSIRVLLFQPEDMPGTRARVSFFMMGSSKESFKISKRLLEATNKSIGKQLHAKNLEFEIPEPTVYVDSPITL